MHGRRGGFTLIELLITLVIAGILVSIAIPNFSGLIQNNRLIAQTNSLVADLNLARSEAVKRAARVSVAAVEGDWSQGWTVHVEPAAPGTLLRTTQATLDDLSIQANTVGAITFLTSGAIDGSKRCLTLSDSRNEDATRIVAIETTGRIDTKYRPGDCS